MALAATEAHVSVRRRRNFEDLHIKAHQGAIWEAERSMCQIPGFAQVQHKIAQAPGRRRVLHEETVAS